MLAKLLKGNGNLGVKGVIPLVSKVAGMLAGYINIWLITHFFSLESLGAFSFLTTVINLTALLSMTGMDTFLLKEGSILHSKNEASSYAGLLLKVLFLALLQAALAGMLYLVFAQPLSASLKAPDYLSIFQWMVAILPLFIAYYLLNEAHRTRGNNMLYSISHHGYGVFTLLILSIGAAAGVTNKLFPFWSFIGASWLLLFIALLASAKVLFTPPHFGLLSSEIRKKALPFFMVSSVTVLLNWSDVLMLGFLTTEAELGAYHTIYRLGLLVTLPLVALNTILPAKFAALFAAKDHKSISALAKSSARISSVGSVLLFVTVLIALPFLLSFLNLPSEGMQTGVIILGVGYLLAGLMGPNGSFLMMANQEKLYSVILGITTVVNILLNFILIHFYGFLGAAFATSFCLVLRNVWCVGYIKSKMGYTFWLH